MDNIYNVTIALMRTSNIDTTNRELGWWKLTLKVNMNNTLELLTEINRVD